MKSPRQTHSRSASDPEPLDRIADLPEPSGEADEATDLDELDLPCTDEDDSRWDAFIADDDERDPLPEPSDFGMTNSRMTNDE